MNKTQLTKHIRSVSAAIEFIEATTYPDKNGEGKELTDKLSAVIVDLYAELFPLWTKKDKKNK